MWARLVPPILPTPVHSEDVRRKNIRKRLLDEDESDTRPLSPNKNARCYSIRPIFDMYKHRQTNDNDTPTHQLRGRRHSRTSSSPAPEPPMIMKLKGAYAELRVTLHSNKTKNAAKTEQALAVYAEDKIKVNLSKLKGVVSRERQLSASILDCEVDTELNSKDGQKRTVANNAKRAVSEYQRIEAERFQQLAHLWRSWESIQTNVDELSGKLYELFDRERSSGRSGMSSNGEYTTKEDFDIDRRIKQVVDDMAACEEKFQKKLKNEESSIFHSIFESSFG
ncbi:hypothetical protein F4678DRAFT_458784 [Xylaria arbuscula]|nr:hypothetical protein F4678DRAFT_458784 [Xylaria arbuscula]